MIKVKHAFKINSSLPLLWHNLQIIKHKYRKMVREEIELSLDVVPDPTFAVKSMLSELDSPEYTIKSILSELDSLHVNFLDYFLTTMIYQYPDDKEKFLVQFFPGFRSILLMHKFKLEKMGFQPFDYHGPLLSEKPGPSLSQVPKGVDAEDWIERCRVWSKVFKDTTVPREAGLEFLLFSKRHVKEILNELLRSFESGQEEGKK